MGWSCTAAASNVLDAITKEFQVLNGPSNGLPDGGFWEIGRENPDGSITGTVWKPYGDSHVVRRGSFKIDPYGKIIRFPGLKKKIREKIEKSAVK